MSARGQIEAKVLSSYSFGLVVAKAGFHNVRSKFGPHIWIFSEARWSESEILDSDLSLESRVDLSVYLLRRSTGFSLACWLPLFVGVHHSVVAHRVSDLLVAFDVPRCPRKCVDIYLAGVNSLISRG
jgi:hypothetical protein